MPDPNTPNVDAGLHWNVTQAKPTFATNTQEPPSLSTTYDPNLETDAYEEDEGEDAPPPGLGETLPVDDRTEFESKKPSSNAMFALGATAIAIGLLYATTRLKK